MPTQGREPHRLRRGVRRRTAAPAVASAVDALAGASSRDTRPLLAHLSHGVATWEPEGVVVPALADLPTGDADRVDVLLYPEPTPETTRELAEAWELHPVLVEDLLHAHQRPKLERYGNVIFLVARAAWYVDRTEEVQFAEFHVLVRPHAVAVLCQDGRWIDGSDVAGVPAREGIDGVDPAPHPLLDSPELLLLGPEAVAYRLLDAIVDGYEPVLEGLAIDQEQIERQVFGGDAGVTERIYRLSQEVIDLKHACTPLTGVTGALLSGPNAHAVSPDLKTYLTDVSDHLVRVDAEVSEMRLALAQMLDVNATLVAQRQNEDMKKISGWAAILFSPTLVAAIYGMNFDVMPELHWAFGYPLALAVMVGFAAGLYRIFKKRDWM